MMLSFWVWPMASVHHEVVLTSWKRSSISVIPLILDHLLMQMHKVLIPYFLALVVTPPTHCLEGTLLVYFLLSSLMIFLLLWLRALSLQILSFGPKIDENYESIWKGLNKSSIVKCLRGFHGISRINHGICTIVRGVIYLALHRLRSDLWWWYSSFLLLFQELLVRNPYCIWTKRKCLCAIAGKGMHFQDYGSPSLRW